MITRDVGLSLSISALLLLWSLINCLSFKLNFKLPNLLAHIADGLFKFFGILVLLLKALIVLSQNLKLKILFLDGLL